MTDREIREQLKVFENRIFNMSNSEAYEIKEELDLFCKENNVTAEQMMDFAESGAGEMLYMVTV